jgi:hypothetical protein
VWVAKVGRWFSRLVGGPTVLVGEEILSPHYHLLAVGIDTTVGWKQTAASAIDAVHRQSSIAIAAHPLAQYWPAYEQGILNALCQGHTVVYDRGRAYRDYGDPVLIQLAAEDGTLPKLAMAVSVPGFLCVYSRIAGILGLMAALILGCGTGNE